MKKKFILSILIALIGTNLWAQYNLKENNVWLFGHQAGLDFNSGAPVPISSAMCTAGGDGVDACASVCDTGGHLLFYSSGDTIYNKNNQVMDGGYNLLPVPYPSPCPAANGGNIPGDTTYQTTTAINGSVESALIVPVLNNPNQYYAFSLQGICYADPIAAHLYYSIIDMSLNNGLGGVISTQKGILLDSILANDMIAIPGDNCDIWVLVHGKDNDTFKAYEITKAGLNTTPVLSATGDLAGGSEYSYGSMKVSPNRRRIAISSLGFFLTGAIGEELCNFDPATGIVSNGISLTSDAGITQCFSPDNTKLYVQSINATNFSNISAKISQYDVSLPTATAIDSSRVDLDSSSALSMADMQLGPDGKIYMRTPLSYGNDTNVLATIDSPNNSNTACHLVPFSITLDTCSWPAVGYPSCGYMQLGIHNLYVKPLRDTVYSTTDTTLSPTGDLALKVPSGYFGYLWSDGTTDSTNTITDTGTYWVNYSDYCTYRTDTFVVQHTTGISKINGANTAMLTVYPSPAQATATIIISGINKIKGNLQIIDALGRTVWEQSCNSRKQTIRVNGLAAGMYVVTYTDETQLIRLEQRLAITK